MCACVELVRVVRGVWAAGGDTEKGRGSGLLPDSVQVVYTPVHADKWPVCESLFLHRMGFLPRDCQCKFVRLKSSFGLFCHEVDSVLNRKRKLHSF